MDLRGDGWAYDIGFGGLDHVLASGENVNVLVFDRNVLKYRWSSFQASNIGEVCQFAAPEKKLVRRVLLKSQ